VRELTFGDLGTLETEKTTAPAWGYSADVNEMIRAAHDRPDLCGLKVETTPWWWTGGLSLLHRDVPFYGDDGPPRRSRHFNYAIVLAGRTQDLVVARRGRYALVRLGTGCQPDPGWDS
jgi:hypothetical protein